MQSTLKLSKRCIIVAALLVTASTALAESSATFKITLHIPAKTNVEKTALTLLGNDSATTNNLKSENTQFPEFRHCLNPNDSIASNSSDKKVAQAFHFDLFNQPADFTIDHAMNAVCQGSSTDIFHSINNGSQDPMLFKQDPKHLRNPKYKKNQQATILRLSPV
ncbi:MAG: hypothetical protein K6L75_05910 [Cellvibrionaceae bacterium]